MLNWHCKTFKQLTNEQLYCILKIRQSVFVVEQQCIYSDLDNLDQQCLHLFATQKDADDIVAYSRLIPAALVYPQASFGRVLTTTAARGTGAGKLLISKAIAQLQESVPGQDIKIQAQAYLTDFYQSFGFKCISEIYLEDDIDHIDMLLTFPPVK